MVIMRAQSLHLVVFVLALYGLGNVKAAGLSGNATSSRADVVDQTSQRTVPSAPLSPAGSHPLASQLSVLRTIAVDVLQHAEAGDLPAARKRIDDLERAWTRVAAEVKTVEPDQAKAIDSAIDRAERELRFWRARRTDSVEALRQVVTVLDGFK